VKYSREEDVMRTNERFTAWLDEHEGAIFRRWVECAAAGEPVGATIPKAVRKLCLRHGIAVDPCGDMRPVGMAIPRTFNAVDIMQEVAP
jgi:hypothetical protein